MAGRNGKVFLERLVYKPELMRRTGATYPTLLREIADGRLAPGRLVRGKLAWRESDVLAYIEALPMMLFKRRFDAKRERARA